MGVFVCVCVIFGCNFFDLVSVVSLTTLTSLTFYSLKIDISTITSSLLAAWVLVGWIFLFRLCFRFDPETEVCFFQ